MLTYLNSLHTDTFRMVLTRQEKEKEILNLYNCGKTYKEIAETVRVSPRDIKPVLRRAEKERERELGKTQEGDNGGTGDCKTQKKIPASSQAYRLFSEGKTPLDVAIELNLKEPAATRYYRQYWKLNQLHSLNMVYEEIGDDIIHIPKIHRKIRAAGMSVDQAINLIKNANNELPTLEQKYQKLTKEVNLLESRKLDAYKTLSEMQDQIDGSGKMLEWLETSCQEVANIDKIEQKKIRLKRLVKLFKENDKEYLKIKDTVKEEVMNFLLEGKQLLRFAIYSIMESMRKDPEKYSSLIYYGNNNTSSTTLYGTQYSRKYQSQFGTYDPFFEALKSSVLENSHKLYEQLLIEEINKVISQYTSSSSTLLPTTIVTMLRRETRYFRGRFDV
jgi:predicted transcriptional regulator